MTTIVLTPMSAGFSQLVERLTHMSWVIARDNRMGLEISQHLPLGLLNQTNTIHPTLFVKITFTDQKHWVVGILDQRRQLRH